MIWLFIFLFISILIVLGVWMSYYKYLTRQESKDLRDSFLEFILNKKKNFLTSILFGFLLTILLVIKPLYYTVNCGIKGTSMKTETSYSWVLGECLYKSKTGAMLPLKISRDTPEGDNYVEE